MFLANENFPKPSITILRDNGFVIHRIQEDSPGVSDQRVIEKAGDYKLIILTFDRDYGELIFRYATQNSPAVIYFRDKGANPLFAGQLLLKLLLQEQIEFHNAFSVVEEKV
jgi:predicted nuclease of predicted toxin-antitoxin system